MSVLDLAREEIRSLTPYSSARSEFQGTGIALNANESPWSAPPGAAADLNRYPDPQPTTLLDKFAALYNVSRNQVLVGRGSDEAIDLLVRAFCRAGQDSIAICPPTFGMYAVAARIQGARVIEVPLDSRFLPDISGLLETIEATTRLVFLCTPNNPTGAATELATIETLVAALRGRAVVVVDEAYIEFSDGESATTLLNRYDNLAILRTLSKAHALAGARVGVLLAQSAIVDLLRRILAPYPLPTPSIAAALAVLDDATRAQTRQRVAVLRGERERMRECLAGSEHVIEVLPSSANFLCVRWRDREAMYRQLLGAGVVVRDVGRYPRLQDCLRLSVGSAEQNDSLLSAINADTGRPR